MAAFIQKQSRELLVPSLPLRLLMIANLCHVALRSQVLLAYEGYACIMHKATIMLFQINY